jgi:Ca-activated chloride channel family protein
MRRAACAALLLAFAAGAGAMSWSDLWLRKDQQAEAALEAGQAAAAANLFEDPRLRGYADLKAQRYAEAAKQLAPLSDPESQYNRGNALARGGELRAALAAYDAALKRAPPGSPLMRDAKANRDLVARQLQEQHGNGKNQPGQPPGGGRQSGKDQSGKDQSGKDDHSASQGGSAGAPPSQPENPQQAGAAGQQSQASNGGAPGTSTPATPDGSAPPRQPPGAASRDAQPPPQPSDAEQARQAERDARAALEPASRQPPPGAGTGSSSAGTGSSSGGSTAARAPADAPPKPPTEQALALDQWLRWIPDDPGGLLRRKFLIEHMMKQRDGAQ